jgi:hypothetical protein
MMINILIIFLAFFAGGFSKFSDILEDSNKFQKIKKYSWFFGLIYGLLIFLAIFIEPVLLSLALGTIIALILMKKIDGISHIVGVVFVFLLLLFFYFLNFGINFEMLILIFVFFIANVLDEIISDYADKHKNKAKRFFELRPFLEIIAFLVAFLLNQWIIWFTIFSYDLAYYIISRIERK